MYDYALTKNERALIAVPYLFITYNWCDFLISTSSYNICFEQILTVAAVLSTQCVTLKGHIFLQKLRYCINQNLKVLLRVGKYIRKTQGININAKSINVSFSRLEKR